MNPEFWRRLPMRLWLRSAETWCAILVAASTALAGDLPDSKITPGLADSALTKDVIGAPLRPKEGNLQGVWIAKDRLERKLHAEVCVGSIDLEAVSMKSRPTGSRHTSRGFGPRRAS